MRSPPGLRRVLRLGEGCWQVGQKVQQVEGEDRVERPSRQRAVARARLKGLERGDARAPLCRQGDHFGGVVTGGVGGHEGGEAAARWSRCRSPVRARGRWARAGR